MNSLPGVPTKWVEHIPINISMEIVEKISTITFCEGNTIMGVVITLQEMLTLEP
jgi:hypothetical protein